jgi:phosphatidylinositol kinase/protein kinase (PI-3  family)
MDTSNAALATAVVLGIRYNQQLNDEEKKDIWKSLPKTWNTRTNYADRVKDNSKYLILEQKNTKDPKLIAKSNPKDVYTYKGNANAKYKKDKNGNWYINSGSKTNNKFVRLDDPTGARSKLLDANATKLKKFTR